MDKSPPLHIGYHPTFPCKKASSLQGSLSFVPLPSRHLRSIFWESISIVETYLWPFYEYEVDMVEPTLFLVDALVPQVIEDAADLRFALWQRDDKGSDEVGRTLHSEVSMVEVGSGLLLEESHQVVKLRINFTRKQAKRILQSRGIAPEIRECIKLAEGDTSPRSTSL